MRLYATLADLVEVAAKAEREVAQQLTVDSGEAQIFLAKEAVANRRDSSPPTSELSMGKMNTQAPGFTFTRCLLLLPDYFPSFALQFSHVK